MIPNVTRGGRPRGLLKYLTTPQEEVDKNGQRREVHTNPHLVAGSGEVLALWEGYDLSLGLNNSEAVSQLTAWLEEPRARSGTRVTVARASRHGRALMEEPRTKTRTDAHVWHCSLSLPADDRAVDDNEWANICREFVTQMGFEDTGCRWLAIHHGPSVNDNDHVHIVVQLVGEDGRAANVHNDRPRAQECARQLEERHGLHVVEGRAERRGARTTTPAQRKVAEELHQEGRRTTTDPAVVTLERAVRAAAQASPSEADFVRRLRAGGYSVRPRFEAGRDDRIVGFSIAEPTADGQRPVPYAAGKLAKDLTLPRLRAAHGWRADEPAGIDEWRRAFTGQPPGAPPLRPGELSDEAWDEAITAIRDLRDQTRALGPDQVAERAQVAGQAAALAYGWAPLADQHGPMLNDLGRQLARSSQVRAQAARPTPQLSPPRAAAMLLAAATRPSNQTLYWLVLLQELQALASAIRDLHQAAGDADRARALNQLVHEQLRPARETLADEHAAADPSYAAERQRRRDTRADGDRGQAPPSPTPAPQQPAARRRPPIRRPRGPGHNR